MTAFPDTGRPTGLVRDWWNEIIGEPPENVVEEPRKGTVHLQGTYEGERMLMSADKSRLDIRQLFERPQVALSTLPKFTDVLPPFVQLAVRWISLDALLPIQRLAFGAIVMKPSSHIEDCRDALGAYLPSIDMQMTDLRDFLYQVNRRRSSETISNLKVNRLMKWSVQHIQEILVRGGSSRVAVGNMIFGSQLEVDINSAAEQVGSLSPKQLVPLFEEFARLADEIIVIGDHP